MSYDSWKTTDPADATLGRSHGEPDHYVCLDCGWTGIGSIARAQHWGKRIPHHRIVWSKDPRAVAKRAQQGAA